ncbi:MAG: OadG family protein [Deltaproteobacteria bacterium]|nr:OadG family protein [Deltaproteobacteria bacterium]
MQTGFNLTIMGMGVVFLVLSAIWLSVVILGYFEKKFPVSDTGNNNKLVGNRLPVIDTGITELEIAVIKAAISQHTGKQPDSFDIKVKNK